MSVKPTPDGYHGVTPYLSTNGTEDLSAEEIDNQAKAMCRQAKIRRNTSAEG